MISLRPGRLPPCSGRVWLLLTHRAPRLQPWAVSSFDAGAESPALPFGARRSRRDRLSRASADRARDGGNMNEHQALRISGTDPAPVAPFTTGAEAVPSPAPAPHKEYRSGVFAKGRRDAGGGWGLVLIDLVEPPRSITLSDGAVIGSTSREARV